MSSAVSAEIEMVIVPLGGGQEVGRSCILLQFQGRNIMLDCGAHPGREGSDALPFFDSLDDLGITPADVDMVLVTHFHIDHCAALPYFTEKTDFKGRIFMTHATKAVMKLLLSDNIRLQHNKSSALYSEEDLQRCIDKVELLDYHESVEHRGIKVSATPAGHVLGAAMFMCDIDGIRVLYTGDYSLEEDRHLIQAQLPPGPPPDVMIVESTFGITTLPPRAQREKEFTSVVESIVRRGGSCLIPVFALGRAQELLLILDEYWQDHPELQSVPIFYASKLATRSLRVYQTFINMMNAHVRELMDQFHNPFKLRHIQSIQQQQQNSFELMGPCVVMASPGFMQSGVSRQLFEAWCEDERHGVVIAGYTIEGTLAGDLLAMPTEIQCLDNRIKPRRCQIEHISFSAHVDYNSNKRFIREVLPDYIILVHGEKTQMRRLKDSLEAEIRRSASGGSDYWPLAQHRAPSIAMPENGVKVKLRFRKNIVANCVGSVAASVLAQLDSSSSGSDGISSGSSGKLQLPEDAVLVTEDFQSKVVAAQELNSHSSCKFGRIIERLMIPLPAAFITSNSSNNIGSSGVDNDGAADREVELLEIISSELEEVFDWISIRSTAALFHNSDNSSNSSSEKQNEVVEKLLGKRMKLQQLLAATTAAVASGAAAGALKDLDSCAEGANFVIEVQALVQVSIASPQQQQQQQNAHVLVQWRGSPIADTVADCVVGLILQAFSTLQTLRRSISNTSASNSIGNVSNSKSRSSSSVIKKQKTVETIVAIDTVSS